MTQTTTLIFEGTDGELRVSPPLRLDNKTGVDPANLTQFAPHGNGMYGYQESIPNPIMLAPPQDDTGGFLYFGNGILRDDFEALMRIAGVCSRDTSGPREYAVFHQKSENPGKDGYLEQIRIVSRFALRFMFGLITESEYESFEPQTPAMADALWCFMQNEIHRYGTSFGSPELDGKFGGDGHFAQEELCFGFMVENDYHGVYRLWSRAWLVTK